MFPLGMRQPLSSPQLLSDAWIAVLLILQHQEEKNDGALDGITDVILTRELSNHMLVCSHGFNFSMAAQMWSPE